MLIKNNNANRGRIGRGLAWSVIGAPILAAASWIGYSQLCIPHAMPLPPALDAERRTFSGRAGQLSYYVAGHGAPLLLIHSINAAASSYEVRPLFEHYRQSRRVYALDLPGFGFSDRSPRDYNINLYTDAIRDMLDEIARESGPAPLDALALSLSSEFLARVAVAHPERFRTLALITPTGFGKDEQFYGEPGSTRGNPRIRQIFELPLWSRPFFDLLNTQPSARFFLKQTFGSYEAIDQGLLDYDYLTAHQPEAQHAPYAFISGILFGADIDNVYEAIDTPVWLAYGERGQFNAIEDTAAVQARGNWTIQSYAAGALPFFEQPEAFFAAYEQFLQQPRVVR